MKEKMDLEEAMDEIYEHGIMFTWHPARAVKALRIMRKALQDHIRLQMEYEALQEENKELKQRLQEKEEQADFCNKKGG